MDPPKTRREKKGNKEKRNKELNGKFSTKHIRIQLSKSEKSKSKK